MRMKDIQPSECVLEIVTPRTNAARLSPAEHLIGALVLQAGASDSGAVSLEISADSERRRFLARTATTAEQRRAAGQLGAAYPQAVLRPFDSATFPAGDPARLGPDEQLMIARLQLRAGEYLPLRTLDDRDLDETAGPRRPIHCWVSSVPFLAGGAHWCSSSCWHPRRTTGRAPINDSHSSPRSNADRRGTRVRR
jgi:hypothetical protein